MFIINVDHRTSKERTNSRWEDNTEIGLGEIRTSVKMKRIKVATDETRWQAFMHMVINFRVA